MWVTLPTGGDTSSPGRRGCDWLSYDSRPLPSVDGSTGVTVADVTVVLSLSLTVVREEVEARTDESLTAESQSHPENRHKGSQKVYGKKTMSKTRECVAGCN